MGEKKVTQALVEGRGINIKGGNYVFTHCRLKCKSCNEIYEANFIRDKNTCPNCHSHKIVCKNKGAKCKKTMYQIDGINPPKILEKNKDNNILGVKLWLKVKKYYEAKAKKNLRIC